MNIGESIQWRIFQGMGSGGPSHPKFGIKKKRKKKKEERNAGRVSNPPFSLKVLISHWSLIAVDFAYLGRYLTRGKGFFRYLSAISITQLVD